MKTGILIGLTMLLAGCVTPQATKPLTAGVDLKQLDDNPTWKSDESTRMGLISYPVSQIGEFIQNNGRVST